MNLRFAQALLNRPQASWPSLARLVLLVGASLSLLATAPRWVCGVTLTELLNGDFIDVGSSRFSNFELLALDTTAVTAPDFSQFAVVPLVINPSQPGLRFLANSQLTTSGINSLELLLKFRVNALAGNSLAGQRLEMTGVSFVGSGGLASVTSELADVGGNDLGSTVVIYDNESSFFQLDQSAPFAARTQVSVVMDVFVTGFYIGDTVNLSMFNFSVAQTGLPFKTGDFNRDEHVDALDIPAMLGAVANLGQYQAIHGLTNADLLKIGDINNSGALTNADVQALVDFLKGGGGSMAAVPEPTSLALLLVGVFALLAVARAKSLRLSRVRTLSAIRG